MRNNIHLTVTQEKMPTLSGYCIKFIKNHNLCIILILSFLLVSYLQRRINCVFKNCGYSDPPSDTEERPGPPPPSPQGGGGENQSCLTTDIGFGNMIPVRSKRSLRGGQSGSSQPEEPPWGATMRSHPEEPP